MINRWRKFLRLSRRERELLVFAALLMPATALGLRVFGFRRWQAVLSGLSTRSVTPAEGDRLEQARRTARMVGVAAWRGLYRASCLPQSLALWFLLRRQGIESELRIGVRGNADLFEAHAWVECLGQALNDTEDVSERFAPFSRAASKRKVAC